MTTTKEQIDNYLEELASNELVAREYEEEIAYWEQVNNNQNQE